MTNDIYTIQENIRRINASLPRKLYEQKTRIYNVAGIKEKYSEPVPNNYSFILVYGKEGVLTKLKEQADYFKPLNDLSECLYEHYLQYNIDKLDVISAIVVKENLYQWGELIKKGNYFLTWKLFIELDVAFRKSQVIHDIDLCEKFQAISKRFSERLLSAWEIGIAVSQRDIENALTLISDELESFETRIEKIEVSKILSEPNTKPLFPTIKLHFSSFVSKKEIVEISSKLFNLLEQCDLGKGSLKESFGEKLGDSIRIQQGFVGLKNILRQIGTLDIFYCPDNDYAYRMISKA
jgi:hypothetical protein